MILKIELDIRDWLSIAERDHRHQKIRLVSTHHVQLSIEPQ
jgi:hypothetical protein